jgi:hypothetical protein
VPSSRTAPPRGAAAALQRECAEPAVWCSTRRPIRSSAPRHST